MSLSEAVTLHSLLNVKPHSLFPSGLASIVESFGMQLILRVFLRVFSAIFHSYGFNFSIISSLFFCLILVFFQIKMTYSEGQTRQICLFFVLIIHFIMQKLDSEEWRLNWGISQTLCQPLKKQTLPIFRKSSEISILMV